MQLADTVLVMCILMSAYFIRGITGFGSALISVPLLALSQPLQFAIPLVLALDFTASVVLGSTNTKKANWSEIKILLPAGMTGASIGAFALLRLPTEPVLVALGAFTMFFGFRNIFGLQPAGRLSRSWAIPAGLARAGCVADRHRRRIPAGVVPGGGAAVRAEAADGVRPRPHADGARPLHGQQGAHGHHERGHAEGGRDAPGAERPVALPEGGDVGVA